MSDSRNTAIYEPTFLLAQAILTEINLHIRSSNDIPNLDFSEDIYFQEMTKLVEKIGINKVIEAGNLKKKIADITAQAEVSFCNLNGCTLVQRDHRMIVSLAVTLFGVGECDEQAELAVAKLLLSNCQLPIYYVGLEGMCKSNNPKAKYDHAFVIVGQSEEKETIDKARDLHEVLASFSAQSFFIDPFYKIVGKVSEFSYLLEKDLNTYKMDKVVWMEKMNNFQKNIGDVKNSAISLADRMLNDMDISNKSNRFEVNSLILNKTAIAKSGTGIVLGNALFNFFNPGVAPRQSRVIGQQEAIQDKQLMGLLEKSVVRGNC